MKQEQLIVVFIFYLLEGRTMLEIDYNFFILASLLTEFWVSKSLLTNYIERNNEQVNSMLNNTITKYFALFLNTFKRQKKYCIVKQPIWTTKVENTFKFVFVGHMNLPSNESASRNRLIFSLLREIWMFLNHLRKFKKCMNNLEIKLLLLQQNETLL